MQRLDRFVPMSAEEIRWVMTSVGVVQLTGGWIEDSVEDGYEEPGMSFAKGPAVDVA